MEIRGDGLICIEQVVMFEVPERAEMENQGDGHDFTVGQRGFSHAVFLTIASQKQFFPFSCSKNLQNSSIIQKISKVSLSYAKNFVLGNHSDIL